MSFVKCVFLGGISGGSMVPMLHTAVLPLTKGELRVNPPLWQPGLVEPWAPLQGGGCGWVWDRHPLVTRAPPSWAAPILGLEDVFEWDP